MDTTAWPAGVIARYLTVGGAPIKISPADAAVITYIAACDGCLFEEEFRSRHSWDNSRAAEIQRAEADAWAQTHARICRDMPKPEATRCRA